MSIADITTPADGPLRNRPDSSARSQLTLVDSSLSETDDASSIFQELFEPCLAFESGDIYSHRAIQNESAKLSKTIKDLSMLQIPYTETREIQDFIEAYRTKIAVFKAGPGKNTHRTFEGNSFLSDFCRTASAVLCALEVKLGEIDHESHLAFEIHQHEQDKSPSPDLPSTRNIIDTNSGELAKFIVGLDKIASFHDAPTPPKRSGFSRILGRAS